MKLSLQSSALFLAILLALTISPFARDGARIYKEMCASCHGTEGEGVAEKYNEPLYGDRTLRSLSRYIDRYMPEEDPDSLDAEGAEAVAKYIFESFYSPAARSRSKPPQIELARLTVHQYQNSVADLFGSATIEPGAEQGLKGDYYNARNFNTEKRVFTRVDLFINFDFEEGSPSADTNQIGSTEFAIQWRGSLVAEETGDYEFRLVTENGARLFLNGDRKPLIDGWVSAAGELKEQKETVRLLGGRAYPIRVDFFKFKDKTASVALEWKPPHKTWEVIPARNLRTRNVPPTIIVETSFPPDDASAGYERGTAVSKEWHQATTYAAIEVADKVLADLERLPGGSRREGRRQRPQEKKEGEADPAPTPEELEAERLAALAERRQRLITFCEQVATKAFRRPLSPEQKELFIQAQFKEAHENHELDLAVKRTLLLVLKSPRFLYPELPDSQVDSYAIASRLALAFWDSLPDRSLTEAAEKGSLADPHVVHSQAQRMLRDPRTRAKIRTFFQYWLKTEEAEDLSKDPAAFPDFTDKLLADLRTSLDLFVDDIVWSPQSDYRQLLLADHLFLNNRLKTFYGPRTNPPSAEPESSSPSEAGEGVPQVVGARPLDDHFQKVQFEPGLRAGVLTHPYLLSAFAYYRSTSPIHRGVFLSRSIVGRTLKPPPQAIQFMDGRFDPKMTMREKVTELTSPAACQSCHTIINPLGFSLEHFDSVGRFRTTENDKPIDATSEYLTSEGELIKFRNARDVAEHAANNEEAHRAFVRQLFQHIVKQPAPAYGADTLLILRDKFAANGFNIQKLMLDIAQVSALHGVDPVPTTTSGEK